MNRRLIALLLIFAVVFSFINVSADTVIKDIDSSSSYAREAILQLEQMGVIKGDEKGNFSPQKSINRAELVALLCEALKLDMDNLPEVATFKDVPKSHWAFKYVEAAYRAGIVNGISRDEFGVGRTSNREQLAVMLVRAFRLYDEVDKLYMGSFTTIADRGQLSDWSYRDVELSMTAGFMNGVGNGRFNPKGNATKEQVATVLYRFMKDEAQIVNKVNQTYGINKDFRLVMNGDIIASKNYYVDENKNLYVTENFVIDYMQQGDEAGVAAGLEELSATKDGVSYIPLKDAALRLGFKYDFDAARNKVFLENWEAPRFSNLYNAFERAVTENYVGTIDTDTYITMRNQTTGDYAKSDGSAHSQVNKDAAYTYSYVRVNVNGQPGEGEMRQTETADKLYIKDGSWVEYDKKELNNAIGQDLFAKAGVMGPLVPQSFLANYKELPLGKSNTTNDGFGFRADTYELRLNSADIQRFMAMENYDEARELIRRAYGGTEKYFITYSIVGDQLVGQIVRFKGQITDAQGNKIDVSIHIQTDYKDIGKAGTVTLPAPYEIVQPK